MKKILSLFAAVLMAGTLLADSRTIYLKPTNVWSGDGPRYAVHAFNNDVDPKINEWYNMAEVSGEDGIYQTSIDTKYTGLIFCRMKPDALENKWENCWNQTKDLGFVTDDMFTIKYKHEDGVDKDKYDGEWSKFTPTPKGFYVTGDKAFVTALGLDENMAWHADAKHYDKDTAVLALKKGDYKMKITINGTWDTPKGYSKLTEKATGLYAGSDDNICFSLAADGDVKVIYNAKLFKLEGAFDASQVVTLEDGFYLIGQSGWEINNINVANKLEKMSDDPAEYKVETTLAKGQSLKVVYVENNAIKNWYPDGEGKEYNVDAKHAGKVTIYFRPGGNEDEGWKAFGGFMYITEPGEPTPDPSYTGVYYITGNEALLAGTGKNAWTADAIKSEKDTFELNLKAGDYQLKLTLSGTWAEEDKIRGFGDLTEKAKGLTASSDDNICFTLAEAGVVKVIYTGIVFKLVGAFDESKVPTLEDGFYLIGQSGWDVSNINAANKFKEFGSGDEYKLEVTLVYGQSIKIVYVENNEIKNWYPDGMGTDYTVDGAHAGKVTIYFKSSYQDVEDWKAFGGFMYIEPAENPGPTPEPPYTGTYFITGDSALVVDAGLDVSKEWDLEAIKSEKDTFVLNLKASPYKLKVVLGQGTEAVKKGFSALTEKAKGLYADVEDNICFSLTEPGEVKVIYTGSVFKLVGAFNENVVTIEDGFYLIGQKGMTIEDLDATMKFAPKAGTADVYELKITLEAGQKIKVAQVENAFIKKMYPDGSDNAYVVDGTHAGEATISFCPTAKEEWKPFGGYMYIEVEKQEALENTAVEGKAVKFIENGQLIILMNGVKYNVIGARL